MINENPPAMDCANGVHHFIKGGNETADWTCEGCKLVLPAIEIAFCRGRADILALVKKKEAERANAN